MKRQMKPVHPGAILREDILNEMNLTVTIAATRLGISRKHLSGIVNEQVSMTAEMAVRLEQAFGVEAGFWLDLQKKYDIWKVHQDGNIHVDRIRA
ncbi:MAG: HigA family addiction module antitoxin [Ginsengibacter sp.]